MLSNLWHKISFLPMRASAWHQRKAVGIQRDGYVRVYDYRRRKRFKYRIYRFFNTLAHFVFKRRRTPVKYTNLAKNGYIYEWAARLLIRYKAKEVAE